MQESENAKTRAFNLCDDESMLSNRANMAVNFAYAVTLIAPPLSWTAIRLARRASYNAHRILQLSLLSLCIIGVLVLETHIRIVGGSGVLIRQARLQNPALARGILYVHIAVAMVTYSIWCYLAAASWRRYRSALPGTFSRRHRQLGWLVFVGLCFTAVSASIVYWLAFIS